MNQSGSFVNSSSTCQCNISLFFYFVLLLFKAAIIEGIKGGEIIK